MVTLLSQHCNGFPQHARGAVPEGEPGDRGGAVAGGEGHVGEQRPLLHLLPHHQPHQQVQHQLQGQSVAQLVEFHTGCFMCSQTWSVGSWV